MKSMAPGENPSNAAGQTGKSSRSPRRRCWGMLRWKEHWVLSWKAVLVGAVAVLLLGTVALRMTHSFLAVNRPVGRGILVVEGWIPPYTVHQAATVFAAGNYQQMIVVRPVYEGEPGVMHGQVAGDYAKTVLVRNGVPSNRIEVLLFPGSRRDRTYHSATAAKKWLAEHTASASSLDVVTIGPHARRSRLLYQEAFGPEISVGVIALNDPTYDGACWWQSSEGTREVLSEALAYLHTRMISDPE